MDAKGAAEAALFASPENLRISDIAERTGFPEEEIRTALMDLRREYEERDSAIVIAKIGSEYGMMLRAEYSDFPGMFGKAEMSGGLMRTLSTIAYNQPVLQSELVRTRGPRGYDDVHRLIEMGFVSGKKYFPSELTNHCGTRRMANTPLMPQVMRKSPNTSPKA